MNKTPTLSNTIRNDLTKHASSINLADLFCQDTKFSGPPSPRVMLHTCHLGIQDAKRGYSQVEDQPGLLSKPLKKKA